MSFNASKYINDFITEKYDRINLTVPKGEKDRIKAHCDSTGESVNGFLFRAINETIDRDNEKLKKE